MAQPGASASNLNDDKALTIAISPAVSITDVNGQQLKTLSSTGDNAERQITAETLSGLPVNVVVQGAPASAERVDVQPQSTSSPAAPSAADPSVVSADGTTGFNKHVKSTAVDVSSFTPRFAYGATPSTVTLAWAPVAHAASYVVTRDGVELAGVTGDSVQDSGLSPASTHVYEVNAISTSSGVPVVLSTRTTAIKTPGRSLQKTATGAIQPYTYQQGTTAFVWKTFIPEARVSLDLFASLSCESAGQSGVTFGGDNRSYVTPSVATPTQTPDYRTQMFVNVNWDNPQPYDFYLGAYVAASHKYVNGTLVSTKTAPATGMKFTNVQHGTGGSYASVRLTHSVGNPFCSLGSINYNANVNFYRSGTVEVVGSRYPVPAHEGYARFDNLPYNSQWVNLFKRSNQGFDCLSGYCTNDSITASQTR